ncbi:MAG: tetrahydrofolate dehydrogenase/cyclohydrolase catalytic domain-containing protein [Methylacidiphilales bacterium]|nr:tetrahydrofolate dehydrogenase/cyclohydrolase catalytic domain-containing protein [Candidatus Methylacidiphilales bacterium]
MPKNKSIDSIMLDGNFCSEQILKELRTWIKQLLLNGIRLPSLTVFLIGDNDASKIYVQKKIQACNSLGIQCNLKQFSNNIKIEEILSEIDYCNTDQNTDGILVQLPLPSHLSTLEICSRISPSKDIDGFNPQNVGRLALRSPQLRPCTPKGVMALLDFYKISPESKHAVVVGVSNLVGRPLALELLLKGATVTCCHRLTNKLEEHVKKADLLCVATGKRNIIDCEWIPRQCTVIDIGINRDSSGKIVGDLDQEKLVGNVYAYTPVPGGIGPMTVTMVLVNTLEAHSTHLNLQFISPTST